MISDLEQKLFELFNLQFTDISNSPGGFSGESHKALFNDKTVFLRIADRDLSPIVHAYQLAQSINVPVPKILFHLQHPDLEYEILVTENAEGTDLSNCTFDLEEGRQVYKNIGASLRKLHSMPVIGFGSFVSHKNAFEGEYSSWQEYLKHKKRDYKILLQEEVISTDELEKIDFAYQSISDRVPQSSFVHNDYHGGHIFITNQNVSGVIDFSKAGGGDRSYDVAVALNYLSENQTESFLVGYGDIDMETVTHYKLFIAANKAVWSTENGFESKTDANKKLERLVNT